MMSTSIISFVFGATLALRFRVLALVPAMAIVMALSVVAGSMPPQGSWWFFKMAAAAAVCLQCGYFAGIIARYFLAAKPSQGLSQLSPAETSTRHAAPY